uniref:GAR domain-containing protein n=1 Tax=Kalmanozyma brasiliensis (strain GHG001) TaxID=1365824 RepID=V5F0J3_KALBG
MGEEIGDAHDAIQIIQSHIFSIQEQRHGIRSVHDGAKKETSSDDSTLGGVDLSLMQLDEQLEALSRTMQQLEVRFSELRDPSVDSAQMEAGDTSIIDKEMADWQGRARRNSITSFDSLGSLDDMALPGFAPALTPRALQAKYDALCTEWTSIQEEVEALKKELADDKYLDVFRSVSVQAEGMMDSLDKAVSLCNIFVQQIQRDHLAGKLQRAAAVEDDLEDSYDVQAKYDELVALTKTFGVKRSPIRNRATSMANAATGAVEKGVLGRSPAGRPMSIVGSRGGAGNRDVSGTPVRAPPSSFKPSWHDLETPGANRTRTAQPQSMPRSQSQVVWPSKGSSSAAGQDPDGSIEYLKFSADSSPARPSSSAGQFYRPPSAQGSVGDAKSRKRDSLIPRLSVHSSDVSKTPSRPGSALSQASSSTPMRYMGASRLNLQTPEPAIVARAQRLSMYARAPSTGMAGGTANTPSKRASKPPPTRRSAALVSGRATPLSAAALASLPSADPNSSLRRSSVVNMRSLTNGRTTPTFSDNGSVGGMSTGTWYGPGRGARGVSGAGSRIGSGSVAGSNYGATGPIEQYRANPNDTLDVEVAAICNGLGVALERIDAPLPRGVRLEEGPGKDNRAQYEIGGRAMMCRLLELHRPAGGAGARAGTKAKKILVRVGGGWQDLEQWLLARLSSV